MSQSETHLNVLSGRYCDLFLHCKDYDWTLINKIRNYFRNSLFHRLQYLRNFIARGLLTYSRYVQYVGGLANKTPLEMEWVKVELNELHTEFGKTIKHK